MKKLCFIILAAVLLVSCSKSFIETTPADQKTIDDFYKTPSDAFEALVAAYNILDLSGYGNIWLSSEITSDDCAGGGGTADNGPWQWDRFVSYLDHNSDAWLKYYQGIYRTNIFLQKIDGVNFGTNTALKDRYTGEAHFLRAYYYFDLVRMFGNVPLLTKPIEGENYYIPQAKPDSVYALIVSDLKEAVSKLSASAVSFSSIPSTEYGRATKWAAEALLGRVFLYYTGYYNKPDVVGAFTKQDAIAAIDDVINNSGYGLVDKYSALWRSSAATGGVPFAGQNNKEGVFTIQYSYLGLGNWNQNNGNRVQVLIAMRGNVPAPYYKGWGQATVEPTLWDAYETADSVRRNATIISVDAEKLGYAPATDQFQYTGYFWKKYTPLLDGNADGLGGNFQIDNYDNYMVIRFADVLLMGAELNLNSNLATAQNYYNRVRDRAFGNTDHRRILTADAAGLKLIQTERRLELALEGQRYWDLLRQGMDAAAAAINYTSATNPDLNVTFRKETNGLFEIPQTQIKLSNGTLVQNPGW